MSGLLILGLKNAILVIPLALLAAGVGRLSRRPALAHLLWTLVLLKFLTPSLLLIPVGWDVIPQGWLPTENVTLFSGTTVEPQSSGSIQPSRNQAAGIGPQAGQRPDSHVPQGSRVPQGRLASPSAAVSVTANESRQEHGNIGRGEFLWHYRWHLLAAIWLAGSLVILVRLIWRAWQFHRFLNLVERRHESLGPRAAELALQARIRIAPRAIVVDTVVSPMLWGLGRRASLVFPARLMERLSPAEVDSLLLHELAHFARGDHWVRVLELVTSVLFWWHPVIWWARYELEIAEEQCCDAWVVQHQQGGRISYAEALLATIEFLHEPTTVRPPAACGLGDVPFLRQRLTQIMRADMDSRLPRRVAIPVSLVLLAGASLEPVTWAASATPPSAIQRQIVSWMGTHNSTSGAAIPASLANDTTRDLKVTTSARGATSRGTPEVSPAKSKPQLSAVHPLAGLPPSALWATANAPGGGCRLEARVGHQTRLVSLTQNFHLDLSSYHFTCASFASDGQTFFSGHQDSVVRRWDSHAGGMLSSYKGADGSISSVHVSLDHRLIAAGTENGGIFVWDLATGDELARLQNDDARVACVRWSQTDHRLAVCWGNWSDSGSRLAIWDWQDKRLLMQQEFGEPVAVVEWLPSVDGLLMATWDGRARLLSAGTGLVSAELLVDKNRVSAAAWSADCPLVSLSELATLFWSGNPD